jgi:hypothetical protein
VRSLTTRRERLLYLVDLAADGGYEGRLTSRWLAAIWGLDRSTVDAMAGEANILAARDRETLELRRMNSLRRLDDVIKEQRVNASDDPRAGAVMASLIVHRDRVAGLVLNQAPANVNVNLWSDPRASEALEGALRVVGEVLDKLHPGVSDDVRDGLSEWQRGGAEALTAWIEGRLPRMVTTGDAEDE